ncbi:MAG: PAS domain-containing protein [Prosthecobacter sp.]|nr:PAS domain-containing protein [Prosthecobacter sp.]
MTRPLRVLFAEDNANDTELVLWELRRAGFEPEWHRVDTESDYLTWLDADLDIILSDYAMPEFSGPRALELLRQRGLDVPFIIISGTIGEDVAVEVMKLGATDYLLKDRLARLGLAVSHAIEEGRLRREAKKIEEELRLTHQQFKRLLEHSPAMIYSLKVAGEHVIPQAVSENITDLLGFTVEEASSFEWLADHLHPEDRERVFTSLPETLATGNLTIEYRIQHKDGHYVWVEDNRRVVCDAAGAAIEIAGAWLDITDRQQAEQARQDSELRFRQLAENIQEVFWITDVSKQQMLYISPAYETIWGRSCESLYAAPGTWLEAIHPEDRDWVLHSAMTRQAEGTYDEEYRIIRPDGSARWIRDRAFPVRNAKGEVYRMVGVAVDTTERNRADELLREQASLLDKARDAILMRSLDHRITYWNKGAERLYGWAARDAMGRKISELLYRDGTAFEAATAAVLRDGEWQGELAQVTKAGNQILVEARWTLVSDSAGQPRSILAINTDITEKKKLEQQVLRAQRMESIGTLAGGIAHDLNNVLAPIMMSIDLLKLICREQRALSVLSTIEFSAKRGADMVRQILSFARGMEGERVKIDPAEIIRDLQPLVQDTFPKNIQFRVELPGSLPAILGDPTQVHQVLLNLCVNARDAMPDGGVLAISAEVLIADDRFVAMNPEARPGTYVMIKVRDSGAGIPPEVVEKIFDPFFTTKDFGKGTGLGLSTALGIVKSHGGFLSVESKPGKGTVFTLCFPTGIAPASNDAGSLDDDCPHGQGEQILIVDDEPSVRDITQQTLEAFGYRVLVAADGAEAIALYSQYPNDVAAVLTDMMMPVMDGLATIQVLNRINPAVKVIAAGGLLNDGGKAKAATLGVKHFLAKPFTAQAVLMALKKVLSEDA